MDGFVHSAKEVGFHMNAKGDPWRMEMNCIMRSEEAVIWVRNRQGLFVGTECRGRCESY